MIGRILLTLALLAVAGFVLLVLIGLWDPYEQETGALGFTGIYQRYLASQAGFACANFNANVARAAIKRMA